MTSSGISRDDVVARVRTVEGELRKMGVRRLSLFGSVLRGEARADSDVDLLVEFEPSRKSFDNFLAVCELLEELLERRVEVVTPESLSPFIGPHITAEAEDVLRAA